MTAIQFVTQYYPDAVSFCWRYDNRLRKTTYCILDGNDFTKVLFYNPKGCSSHNNAWVYAKKMIIAGEKDNQGNTPTIQTKVAL